MSESHVPGPPEEADPPPDAGTQERTDEEVAHGHDGAVPEDQIEADRAHQEQQPHQG